MIGGHDDLLDLVFGIVSDSYLGRNLPNVAK
jgi:hypothetical protein